MNSNVQLLLFLLFTSVPLLNVSCPVSAFNVFLSEGTLSAIRFFLLSSSIHLSPFVLRCSFKHRKMVFIRRRGFSTHYNIIPPQRTSANPNPYPNHYYPNPIHYYPNLNHYTLTLTTTALKCTRRSAFLGHQPSL